MGIEFGDDLADQVLRLAAVDGDAAERPHEIAHRPAKQAVLADEMDLPADAMNRAEEDQEIPIGRVRGTHDDEFAGLRKGAGDGPATQPEPADEEPVNQAFEKIELGIDGWLAEDGAEDPDRGHGDDNQQEGNAEHITHTLRLGAGGCLGLAEVNFVALPFHRRLHAANERSARWCHRRNEKNRCG